MGLRNILIEGVSCSGKTTIATELERRGYHVVHGDRALAYQGDPETGIALNNGDLTPAQQTADFRHRHHLWHVDKVAALAADRSHPLTFFCGGCRNLRNIYPLLDRIFILEIDAQTLRSRLDARPKDEFGATPEERALILRLHETREDLPDGAESIDATRPPAEVVEAILARCQATR
ncbi:AAA family ATPase [Allorhizobium taibaishanense]|uniref:Broad-specificity NMP kinase n=1 Tax=Allorhizobium taibaishanense TaxID=887144 RepID=A0A1Q9AC13_9HYPH|nr:AAA family ATPase [Allorhizobium taibaishanense]MBB4007168.1 broad-specificity NMP kinase [Allorhizobium taibaishanense]OLP52420.1 nucleoside kinase [Allorhizobium taibaishanense]